MTPDDKLQRLLAEAKPQFRPYSHYIREADCLHFYTRDVETVRVRIDEVLTVFEGMDDGEFAGCLIKGVRSLLQEADALGLHISKGGKLKAIVVLMAYLGTRPASFSRIDSAALESLREEDLCLA